MRGKLFPFSVFTLNFMNKQTKLAAKALHIIQVTVTSSTISVSASNNEALVIDMLECTT